MRAPNPIPKEPAQLPPPKERKGCRDVVSSEGKSMPMAESGIDTISKKTQLNHRVFNKNRCLFFVIDFRGDFEKIFEMQGIADSALSSEFQYTQQGKKDAYTKILEGLNLDRSTSLSNSYGIFRNHPPNTSTAMNPVLLVDNAQYNTEEKGHDMSVLGNAAYNAALFQNKCLQRLFLKTHFPQLTPDFLIFNPTKLTKEWTETPQPIEEKLKSFYQHNKAKKRFVIKVSCSSRGHGNIFFEASNADTFVQNVKNTLLTGKIQINLSSINVDVNTNLKLHDSLVLLEVNAHNEKVNQDAYITHRAVVLYMHGKVYSETLWTTHSKTINSHNWHMRDERISGARVFKDWAREPLSNSLPGYTEKPKIQSPIKKLCSLLEQAYISDQQTDLVHLFKSCYLGTPNPTETNFLAKEQFFTSLLKQHVHTPKDIQCQYNPRVIIWKDIFRNLFIFNNLLHLTQDKVAYATFIEEFHSIVKNHKSMETYIFKHIYSDTKNACIFKCLFRPNTVPNDFPEMKKTFNSILLANEKRLTHQMTPTCRTRDEVRQIEESIVADAFVWIIKDALNFLLSKTGNNFEVCIQTLIAYFNNECRNKPELQPIRNRVIRYNDSQVSTNPHLVFSREINRNDLERFALSSTPEFKH